MLLGYRLWKERFGGDAKAIGSVVRLNDLDFTVIGVMPPGFRFPHDAEIWKPMGFTADDFDGGHFIWGIGRLKANMTRDQAQAEMDSIMPRLRSPQIWSVAVDGGWPVQLTALDDPVGFVTWSPDGKWLAFSLAPGGGMNSQVFLVRPDGTGMRRMIRFW